MSLARLALPAVFLAAACGAIAEDPHRCGAQDLDCLGGTCSSGVCGPVTLASGIKWGKVLTIDSTRVYWADQQLNVSMVPKSGGSPTRLATLPGSDQIVSIATDGTYVYVATFGLDPASGVYRIPTDGSPATLLDAVVYATSVAVDSRGCVEWSYWGDVGSSSSKQGAIARLCAGATKPEILADAAGQSPTSLAVDATATFWAENVPLVLTGFADPCGDSPAAIRMLSATSPPVTVARGYPAGAGYNTGLASDGAALYWRDQCSGTVYRMPHGASSPTALAKVSTTPAEPGLLGPGGYYYPGLVAVDALGAYTSSDAGVVRVPKDGGATVLVAAGKHPEDMAVDDTRIYLLTSEGDIGDIVVYAKPR